MSIVLYILLVGFLLNVVWEFSHCRLYETCRNKSWRENMPLLLLMAFKDGFFIALFYLVAIFPFKVVNILESGQAIALFVIFSVSFAFMDERISLRLKRWEYAATMPKIVGVGVTPLLEIMVTGLVTFTIVFLDAVI